MSGWGQPRRAALRAGEGRANFAVKVLLAAIEELVALEELGSMALKGITQPVSIFNVLEQQAATASA